MSRFERPIIDCCATWSVSSGWQPLSVSAAMTVAGATNFLTVIPRSFRRNRFGRRCRKQGALTMRSLCSASLRGVSRSNPGERGRSATPGSPRRFTPRDDDGGSSRSRIACALLEDDDLCVSVSPLVDKGEADTRGDLDLRRFLDHAKRIRLKPPSPDERGERRSRKTLPIRRIDKGERKGTAGRRRTKLRRVGAPDASHAAARQRFDIGAQKRARLSAVVDEQREPRAARKSLDCERPRPSEQVNHPRALDLAWESVLKNVEDRLPQSLRGRTNGARRRRRYHAAPETAADDPHRSRLSRWPGRPAGAFRRSFPWRARALPW